jgi:diketogulonate reductase-like aldo/keto reductase/ribosomal protein L10
MHRPVAFSNPNVSQISSIKSQTGRPVEVPHLSGDITATWARMEEMVQKGKVRNIGISNFNIRRTEELLAASTTHNPVINQVEVNFGVANEELLHYSEAHQIMLQAYSPLGGSGYAQGYLEDPVVQDVAQRNNMTPAQVLLAWPMARGIIPIVKSNTPQRIEENFAAAEKSIAWDDVVHLTRESEARGIERTVDPSEAWETDLDIFEDGKDQTRLLGLKKTSLEVPPAHKADGSHFLEPRNDPEAKPIGPGGTAVREMHSLANVASSSRVSRPTALQVALGGRRAMSSSVRARAAAAPSTSGEAAPPSASETPAVSASPLLANSSKAALRTPGLKFTDGEDGVTRETRKMNLYTVRRGARSFASVAASSAPSPAAPSSLDVAPVARPGRTYTARKAFLYEQYARLIAESPLMIVLTHHNLSVADVSRIRRDLAAIPAPEEGVQASLTTVRSGVLRPLLRNHASLGVQSLEEALEGPTALLTVGALSPSHLSRVLAVLERHSGAKAMAAAAQEGAAPAKVPRIVPLIGLVQGRSLRLPALKAVGELPDLATLRAQLVGLLSSPASQLAAVLSRAAGGDIALALEARKRSLEEPSA